MVDKTRVTAIDHLEFAVADIAAAAQPFLRLGFEKSELREVRERQLQSLLLTQNRISIVLSASTSKNDPVYRFVETHGPGLFQIALLCEDAIQAFQRLVNAGVRIVSPPITLTRAFGSVDVAAIEMLPDLNWLLVSRTGSLFREGFEIPLRFNNRGIGLSRTDHLALNVAHGDLKRLEPFFSLLLGWNTSPLSDWQGDPLGVATRTFSPESGVLSITVNEPGGREEIGEFLKINHGPGWQHVGFSAESLTQTMAALKKETLSFTPAPSAYYEALPVRCPVLAENVNELESLQILVDNDDSGYILQAYTPPLLGGFFIELLERKGGKGLGSANYRAWLSAGQGEKTRTGVITSLPLELGSE